MSNFSRRIKAAFNEALFSFRAYIKEQGIVFFMSILACVFLCLNIYDADNDFANGWKDIFFDLFLATMEGCLFTIPAILLSQKLKKGLKYSIQICVAVLASILGFFANRGFGNKIYGDLYFWGITFAVILFTVYIFIPGNSTFFAGLLKHFLFSGLMAGILFGGLSLLIAAFQNLIFHFDDWQVYECCAVFCFVVFAVNIFVYYLFYRRDEENSGKAFKVIFLYILLPVFFTLIALLYIYLLKALILWKLPNGQINWFVSFASCIYIVFYFILREYENLAAVKVFYKYGAFAFIPLICIQIPAYFIRLTAYGFTGWRFSSLLFIIFSIVTIVLTFIKKGKFIKYSLLLLSGIIIFASITPCNLINSAYKSQYNRMVKILEKYGMIDDVSENKQLADYDKEEINQIITEEDRNILISSFNYLSLKSDIPLPEWMNAREYGKPSFEYIFGINSVVEDEQVFLAQFDAGINHQYINIDEYKWMQKIYESNSSWGSIDGKYQDYANELSHAIVKIENQSFDITDFLLSNPGKDNAGKYLWYTLDDEKVLCLTNYDFYWNDARKCFRDYSFSGFVFKRK